MKRTICTLVAIATLGGVSNSANALTTRGSSSCGEWVSEGSRYGMTWLLGYLSGLAMGTGHDVLSGTDHKSIELWMTNYCKANPLSNIADGGEEIFFALLKKKNGLK